MVENLIAYNLEREIMEYEEKKRNAELGTDILKANFESTVEHYEGSIEANSKAIETYDLIIVGLKRLLITAKGE